MINRLRDRLNSAAPPVELAAPHHSPKPASPVSAADIDAVEKALGQRLPPLLTEIYRFVGNGGFGPGYGLTGLSGGATDDLGNDVLTLYRSFREADPEDPEWHWPSNLLPVCHLGDGMQICVRLDDPTQGLVLFDPSGCGPGVSWEGAFRPISHDLASWLQAWLDGTSCLEAINYRAV